MKTLLLLRHGKAQESAPGGDKARRLNEQGRLEAAEMGGKLSHIAGRLDNVLTSDAERALETARIVASGAGYSGQVRVEPDIYSADVDTLLDVVRGINAGECVLLVGHNPGLEYLSAALAQEGTQEPTLPTGGLVHLTFEADRWRDVRPHTARLLGVYMPGG
ncbi:MAG TPA: histidine phosphatase family protein [Chloroflexia bacterium]